VPMALAFAALAQTFEYDFRPAMIVAVNPQ
jgi:hypothetical protein